MFDSGFGGLTVARALIDLLPDEDLVYFGDTGRYPYGPRPLDEVREFAQQITELLVERARRQDGGRRVQHRGGRRARPAPLRARRARRRRDRARRAGRGARPRATAASASSARSAPSASGAYQRAVRAHPARPSTLTCAACPGFVEFVERGDTRSDQVHVLAERLLAPVQAAGVDTLLLGCTHYPFLARTIGDVMGRDVVLVSSADETAFEVRALLHETGLVRRSGTGDGKGRHRFVSSGDVGLVQGSWGPAPRARARRRRGVGVVSWPHVDRARVLGLATPRRAARAAATSSQAGGTTVWLDAGPGTLANLQATSSCVDVDAVVLSHEHPDHWRDLEGYLVACRYGTPSRAGMPVYAPAGPARPRLLRPRAHVRAGTTWPTATASRSAALDISFSRTDHGVETLAVRIDGGGGALGYSADSGPDWSLEALGPALDLALCEATLSSDEEGKVQHMSARQAGASARAAGARRLLLTHLWPDARPRPQLGPRAPTRSARRSSSPRTTCGTRSCEPAARRARARRAAADHVRARLHRVRRRARCSSRWDAPACCAPRRSTRRCRRGCAAAARAGSPPSTRCCPGRRSERIDREVARGQAVGPHAGDPAADRPLAARRHRHGGAGRAADRCRLRRPAGRRRHAHRVDLRRVRRAARRVHAAWCRPGAIQAHPLEAACAAVSVGVVDAVALLDLDYSEDVRAEVDMNVVMTSTGRFIEVQGTAEGLPFSRSELDDLLGLAEHGIAEILDCQAEVVDDAAARSRLVRLVLATANPDKAREIAALLDGLRAACPARRRCPTSRRRARRSRRTRCSRRVAVCDATGEAGGRRRHRPRGRRARRRARACTPPATPGQRATYDDNVAKLLAALDGVPRDARRARFRTVAAACFPDGREVVAEGAVDGAITDERRGERRLRLRPRLRPRRRRRPHLRGDDPRREAGDLPPRPRLPRPRRSSGCARPP